LSDITLDGAALDDLELLLGGAYAPLARYLSDAEAALVADTGRLPDGTPWPLALRSPVPGDALVRDPEGAPVARLTADGRAEALAPREVIAFARLRRPAREVAAEVTGPVLGVPVDGPLSRRALEEIASAGLPVLLLALVGTDRTGDPDALIRMTLAAAGELPAGTRVVAVPLPRRPEPVESRLRVHVAAAYGATHVLAAADGALPVPATAPVEDPAPGYPAAVAAELARTRGLTVFFTGLSGSGKSTVARALAGRLAERGDRTVSLLDGDVVRRSLSAGLGFSREDRDRNITRIGWVAAEVTRHGGVAVCAPIAPYASVRAEVRRLVEQYGDFVLVHVSTPLAECVRRDRKGLYAKARAGDIPAFTGISDPYEVPDDADLAVDTTDLTIAEATDRVLRLLVERGLLRGA
jgi:sulfate adenylyltransferase